MINGMMNLVAIRATPQVPDVVGAALHAAAAQTLTAINTRLVRALGEAKLPSGTDIGALSCSYNTSIADLSGLAKQGTAKNDLTKVVEAAMQIWPGKIERSG